MRKQLNRSVKKYYTLKNFFVYIVLISFIMLSSIIIVQSLNSVLADCKPAKINFSGDIDPGLSEVHEFDYRGGEDCYLIILPSENVQKNVSLWFYRPNGDIEVMDSFKFNDAGALVLNNVPKGKYRVSVRNSNGENIGYDLTLYLASK